MLSYNASLRSEFPVMSIAIFSSNDVRFWLYLQLFAVHVLFMLFVFVLRIVVSNAYCDVFLLCFSSSCVPYVTGFSGLSAYDCPGIL